MPDGPGARTRLLVALIVGQICLHSCMAGVRMASPLLALKEGHAEWAVGVLMGLFAAAPVFLALAAGRLADRHGYHRPMRIAVGLTVAGSLLAVVATLVPGHPFGLLCGAAVCVGAGANVGLITIQRTAGRSARNPTELRRVFSWLGLAPALSNVVGPILAGTLIDSWGFRVAFVALAVLPVASVVAARRIPPEVPLAPTAGAPRRRSWELFAAPGMRRLLLVNWLLSSSWDVHSFVVPILGHERGFSASSIGVVLAVFAGSVALVRLAIPALAHRLREAQVLVGAMVGTAAVFAVYPLVRTPSAMAACAAGLGLALGSVQPMIMTTLHQITPDDRHGESIALRSMTISFSSSLMPLLFGLGGVALGAGSLFWVMAIAVGAGSFAARRVGAAGTPGG